ncbi:MAG: HAMP domain-containing protein, partial [Planctomycetes bacterium]|nr:HAMP domain-containing protein [Planctomycetota bacterium]
MRIGLKLTAAFLVIALLVAAAGYLAQRTGRELKRQMERLSQSAIRQMADTAEVTIALYADQLAAHQEITARSRGVVESLAAERGVAELTELVRSQTWPSSERLQQELAEYEELMDQFRVLLDEDVDAAERFIEQPIRDHFENELVPRLVAIREQAGRESTEGIRGAERELVRADQRRGILLVAAAAVAVSIGLFMSRSIGKPLGTLQRAAQEIGRGCLDTRVAIRSRDEIGMLAAAINQMAAELREKTVSKDRLRASLHEKELLLKEVHHRVKNNLQVISSLLSLQAQEIRDPETSRLFEESQARVRSMALIHEQLYRSDDLAHINFGAYVEELVDNLRQGFGSAAAGVDFRLDVEPIPLLLDVAVPCGMIVNELVANALE